MPPTEKHPGGLLFRLSPELRLAIYDLMSPVEEIDVLPFHNDLIKMPDPGLIAGDYVAYLATRRAIYDEARPVLYKNTRFIIHCSWEDMLVAPRSLKDAAGARYSTWIVKKLMNCRRNDWERPNLENMDLQDDTFN
jgi:hypothetical protein